MKGKWSNRQPLVPLVVTVLLLSVLGCERQVEEAAIPGPEQAPLWVGGKDGYHTYRIPALLTGDLPGLKGRLNPIRDTHNRTYLYASNIAINEGAQRPVHFIPGEDLRLTDAHGSELIARIVDIVGRSALVEYRPYPEVKE